MTYKCENCGTDLAPSEFDSFFTEEANTHALCPECAKKENEEIMERIKNNPIENRTIFPQ